MVCGVRLEVGGVFLMVTPSLNVGTYRGGGGQNIDDKDDVLWDDKIQILYSDILHPLSFVDIWFMPHCALWFDYELYVGIDKYLCTIYYYY